jgi:hypothetical protein
MSRLSALAALTAYTFGRLLAPGRILITAGIFGFPVLVAFGFMLGGYRQPELTAGSVFVYFNLYIVLIAATLFNSLAVTSQELEDGSAPYLYVGVLPRWLILLNRFVILIFLMSVASAVSMSIVYVVLRPMGLSLDLSDLFTYIGISAAGAATYAALYMACGAWFRHSMAASITLTVIWEVIVFMAPTQLWPYTITCCLRSMVKTLVYEGRPPSWLLKVSDINKARGIEMLPPAQALTFLLILSGVLLMIGMWAISRRQLTDRPASE